MTIRDEIEVVLNMVRADQQKDYEYEVYPNSKAVTAIEELFENRMKKERLDACKGIAQQYEFDFQMRLEPLRKVYEQYKPIIDRYAEEDTTGVPSPIRTQMAQAIRQVVKGEGK